MEFQSGDIFVVWGAKVTSKIIGFLEKTISGLDNPPTHIAIALDDTQILSAESNGIRIITFEELTKHAKAYKIYRYKNFTNEHKNKIKEVSNKYLGKGYDYWIYLHWALKILYVYIPFLKLILFPLERWLKNKMKKTFECSEVTTAVWNDLGLTFGIKEAQYTTPVDVYQVLTGCSDYKEIGKKGKIKIKHKKVWYNNALHR